jgi:hypothetical protein
LCKSGSKSGEIDEEAGKLYYFNKYLKGQTLTLEQGSKGKTARAASPSHLLLDAKLQEQGVELPSPSDFLFEMLSSCKDPECVENNHI